MELHNRQTIIADHPMFAGLESSFFNIAVGGASHVRVELQLWDLYAAH